jgi:hypothetical protein
MIQWNNDESVTGFMQQQGKVEFFPGVKYVASYYDFLS